MDATSKEAKVTAAKEVPAKEEKKKKSFWTMFMNFLMMGGFLVILIGVAAIFILVSYLTK